MEMSTKERYMYLDLCFKNGRISEKALLKASGFPKFVLTLIEFIGNYNLENLTQERYIAIRTAHECFNCYLQCMVESEKAASKPILLKLLCTSHHKVLRDFIVDDLLEIADDFSVSWPKFLSELDTVQTENRKNHSYYSINGLLAMIEALLSKFMFYPDPKNYKLLVKHFSESLQWFFVDTSVVFESESERDLLLSSSPDLYLEAIESQRLCCEIFCSFLVSGVAKEYRGSMDEWFPKLVSYLTADFKVASNTVIHGLRISVCKVVFQCMETQYVLLKDYGRSLVDAVRSLLVLVAASESSPSRDVLAEMALRFLWKVKENNIAVWFDREDKDNVLQHMCESIVLPYIMVTDEDERLFDEDYESFIHRDFKDSGLKSSFYTSRRIACDLLYVHATTLPSEHVTYVSDYIKKWFNTFSQNLDENWKHRECALYVVIALANKRYDGEAQSAYLINDLQTFLSSVVLQELQSRFGKFPMLKARALEFCIMFRFLISKPVALTLLPDFLWLLDSDSNVVHSYAARCIEVLRGKGDREFTSADINPYLSEMMQKLLKALEKKGSDQNPYIMMCIVQVLRLADLSFEVAELCVSKLLPVFQNAGNSKDCLFSWNLFEAIDILLRKDLEMNFSNIQTYQEKLFPTLKMVLNGHSSEFEYYASILLCQLVEWHKHSLPACYGPVFSRLLLSKSYDRSDYIQEVQERLFKTFVENAPPLFLGEVSFEQLGEIYLTLGMKRGFHMLNVVFDNISYDVLAPYTTNIWGELSFQYVHLVGNEKLEFCESFLALMSRFVCKSGPEKFVESVAAFAEDIFPTYIEEFWIPYLKLIRCPLERQLSLVASIGLFCGSDVFLYPSGDRIWGGMLDSIVTLLTQSHEDMIDTEEKVDATTEVPEVGHHIVETYDMVSNARTYNDRKRKEVDSPRDRTENAEQQVVRLVKFCAGFKKRCMSLIRGNLSKENQDTFLKICATYGYRINV